ncbi:MAG: hypothetical protein QOI59_2787 [Gammaproteobacteria bacterium]|nr:hypothetical protein [Gammaproteobacteria bacterium]
MKTKLLSSFWKWLFCVQLTAVAALVPVMAQVPEPVASLQQDGPKTLVIHYRAEPQHRAAFRQYLLKEQATMLRKLRAEHLLAEFRILFSWYRQPSVWDAIVELRFDNMEQVAAWNRLERTRPGGLSNAGLALAQPVLTNSADLAWSGAKAGDTDTDTSVYYIIPYEYRNTEEYVKYAQAYMIPQYEGWLKDGALSGYEVLLNRYTVGDPWDVLVVLRYRDINAYGRRQQVLDKVRATLKDNAQWQAYHKRKSDIRSETENSIADLVAH